MSLEGETAIQSVRFGADMSYDKKDLESLNRIGLFSVVAEHWMECSRSARIFLLCHADLFIRSEAREQNKAFSGTECREGDIISLVNE